MPLFQDKTPQRYFSQNVHLLLYMHEQLALSVHDIDWTKCQHLQCVLLPSLLRVALPRCWKWSRLNKFLMYGLNKQSIHVLLNSSLSISCLLAAVTFFSSLSRTVVPELFKGIYLKVAVHLGVNGIGNLDSFALWELSSYSVFCASYSGGVSVRLKWITDRKELFSGEDVFSGPLLIPVSIPCDRNCIPSLRQNRETLLIHLCCILVVSLLWFLESHSVPSVFMLL